MSFSKIQFFFQVLFNRTKIVLVPTEQNNFGYHGALVNC